MLHVKLKPNMLQILFVLTVVDGNYYPIGCGVKETEDHLTGIALTRVETCRSRLNCCTVENKNILH